MSNVHAMLIVAVAGIVTAALRFLPFLIFGGDRKTPAYIEYLGKVLPPAVFALLAVYCLRDTVAAAPTGIALSPNAMAQFIAVAFTIAIHVWKKKLMLSIAAGTICYMVLIRL